MLLTKLIPSRESELKEAVAVFNRFLEEPHDDGLEKMEILISGGRASCKTTIASGMMLKANAETVTGSGVCIVKDSTMLNVLREQFRWSVNRLGVSEDYEYGFSPITVHNKRCESRIYLKAYDNCLNLNQVRGIPRRRFLWIDNAEWIDSPMVYNSIVDSVRLDESNPIVILTYNPPPYRGHWLNDYEKEIMDNNGEDNRWVFKPCFYNIGEGYLGKELFREAERMRKVAPLSFAREFLGIPIDKI